jgi:L-lactate dehydrogenase complex protein LldG
MPGGEAMSKRDTVLASIRRSLGVTGAEAPRRKIAADRLGDHPTGVIPARGRLAPQARLDLFVRMVEAASGTVERIARDAELPAAVAAYLRRNNLPLSIRRGADRRLAAAPWEREGALEVKTGPAEPLDLASVSHAVAAVAETGTVVLLSGPDNPTTLNFLPDNHIVALDAATVAGDYETVLARLREMFGAGLMPRAVNMITGPSRSGDIEQTLILGAHGPRRLHVIVIGEPDAASTQASPTQP